MDICTHLCGHILTSALVAQWVLQTTQLVLWSKIEELTKRSHGVHFDAKVATAEQIKSMFMPQLSAKMHQVAPIFWSLIFKLLGALHDWCMSLTVDPISMNLAEVFEETEHVLEEISGDMETADGPDKCRNNNEADLGPEEDLPHQKRS